MTDINTPLAQHQIFSQQHLFIKIALFLYRGCEQYHQAI